MEFGISLISLGVAFLSVCVAVYSVRESRKSVITGTYFSEMVNAYADYLKGIASYVDERGRSGRSALSSALYKVSLFAPTDICDQAQELYVFVIDWVRSGQSRALAVDERVNQLGNLMREDIDKIRRKGHF